MSNRTKPEKIAKALNTYKVNSEEYSDDLYAYLTCKEALQGVSEQNYGIGGVLVDEKGKVLFSGHNKMFKPSFRSDLHAEMVLLNLFEKKYGNHPKRKSIKIYSSLEPCTMCTARLIFSGIGEIIYVAEDNFGGMIHLMDNLPPAWKKLSDYQIYRRANCSSFLREISVDICMLNANILNSKLIKMRR
jgi:cytosine deaminase